MLWNFTQRADHFVVVAVPDQYDAEAVAREPHRFQMHLGDQRTGGVDDVQIARLCLAPYRRRNAVGAENRPRPGGHFIKFFYKDRTGGTQLFHHMLVVHDLFADVHRSAVQIERNFHHVDRPDNPGAEAARLEQKYLLVRAVIRCERL